MGFTFRTPFFNINFFYFGIYQNTCVFFFYFYGTDLITGEVLPLRLKDPRFSCNYFPIFFFTCSQVAQTVEFYCGEKLEFCFKGFRSRFLRILFVWDSWDSPDWVERLGSREALYISGLFIDLCTVGTVCISDTGWNCFLSVCLRPPYWELDEGSREKSAVYVKKCSCFRPNFLTTAIRLWLF